MPFRVLAFVWARRFSDRHQLIRARVVDLEGGVVDAEPLVDHLLELAPDAVAVISRCHQHVCRQRGEAGGDLPDVQVVHRVDVLVSGDREPDLLCAHPFG